MQHGAGEPSSTIRTVSRGSIDAGMDPGLRDTSKQKEIAAHKRNSSAAMQTAMASDQSQKKRRCLEQQQDCNGLGDAAGGKLPGLECIRTLTSRDKSQIATHVARRCRLAPVCPSSTAQTMSEHKCSLIT
jgi:hypothetical protein